jgi:hypothetical protein
VNSLEQLIEFIGRLQEARIHFDLKCVRDAVMVTVRSPSTYYEIEFFADGHIEVETLGPPSLVSTVQLRDISDRVISDING